MNIHSSANDRAAWATHSLSKLLRRQSAGSALNTTSSASAVLATLGPVLAYSALWFVAFLLLRRLFARNYEPRSILKTLRPQQRSPELPRGLFNWVASFWNVSDTHVLNTQSLDGFLFLRLLKIAVVTCLVGCIITWPILFPINASGAGGQHQLDVLAFGNAAGVTDPASYYRYYAHVFCAWIFFSFVIYMITRESVYYINLRQAYLISPLYAERISSKTVMFNAVPERYLDEEILRNLFGRDKVERVWIPRQTKELEDKVKERDQIALKLEAAETKLIRKANAAYLKSIKSSPSMVAQPLNNGLDESISGSAAARWLKPKDRPTHRLKFLVGQKVDTIDWCRKELAHRIPEVKQLQEDQRKGKGKPLSACFVQFTNLAEAQSAYQSLTHHQALHMAPRYTGVLPSEIIWSNLRIRWWERVIRIVVTTGAISAVVFLWSFPTAFVGTISNINYVIGLKAFHWLGFIKSLPHFLLGLITGLLPSILLALLMALLPIFLRFMATVGGDPTLSAVEYTTQNSYFAFQVTQVFLITTLSSGLIAAAQEIAKNPSSVINLLADSLPKASNFYLCYFILQGLAVVSQTLVAITGLVVFVLLGKLLDNTPRKLYTRWASLSNPGLGCVYPIYTCLFVIAICYSCIAPLVLGVAVVGLYLFYIAYRYEFLYVYDSATNDTKGLMYPRALQQVFVGLYLAELCMIGLLAINLGSSRAVLGPLILMIVLLVFTVLYHISLNTSLSPLIKYLPKTLDNEEQRLLALEDGDEEADVAYNELYNSPVATGANAVPDADHNSIGVALSHDQDTSRLKASQSSDSEKLTSSPQLNRAATMPPPHEKPGIIRKFLRPDIYTDYHTMRRLVPRTFTTIEYDPSAARDAYVHPSISSDPPLLWVPRDVAGVSRQEVMHTSRILPITDEGAELDAKNNIVWDRENAAAMPIYESPVYW